jgi:hypothetical protein
MKIEFWWSFGDKILFSVVMGSCFGLVSVRPADNPPTKLLLLFLTIFGHQVISHSCPITSQCHWYHSSHSHFMLRSTLTLPLCFATVPCYQLSLHQITTNKPTLCTSIELQQITFTVTQETSFTSLAHDDDWLQNVPLQDLWSSNQHPVTLYHTSQQ